MKMQDAQSVVCERDRMTEVVVGYASGESPQTCSREHTALTTPLGRLPDVELSLLPRGATPATTRWCERDPRREGGMATTSTFPLTRHSAE